MWIEIIEIRSFPGSRNLLELHMQNFQDVIQKKHQNQSIKVFTKANLNTDFVILIHNESIDYKSEGSKLGLQMASALKEFGMINHAVWLEFQS